MLKCREFLDLTDDEIKSILMDIFFHSIRIDNIDKCTVSNKIIVDVTTGGWEDGGTEITDEIILSIPRKGNCGIRAGFLVIDEEDVFKWRHFLLNKGCDYFAGNKGE